MEMTPTMIISIILLCGILATSIIYRIVKKRNREDPEIVRKQREREEEYRRRVEEENARLAEEYKDFNVERYETDATEDSNGEEE